MKLPNGCKAFAIKEVMRKKKNRFCLFDAIFRPQSSSVWVFQIHIPSRSSLSSLVRSVKTPLLVFLEGKKMFEGLRSFFEKIEQIGKITYHKSVMSF